MICRTLDCCREVREGRVFCDTCWRKLGREMREFVCKKWRSEKWSDAVTKAAESLSSRA